MKYIFVLILLFNTINCYSQLYIEDKQFELGKYDCLWISTNDSNIKDLQDIIIDGYFKISNPYLFYPEQFDSPNNFKMTDYSLSKINDSIYTFNLVLSFVEDDPFSDILFYLCGYALAGNDSICDIDFTDIRINKQGIESFTGKINIITENHSIPYIRMPELNARINPVIAGELIFDAVLWQDSDLSFEVYDIIGNIKQLDNFSSIKTGENQFVLTTNELSSGIYNILMHTNHGTAMERVLLIK